MEQHLFYIYLCGGGGVRKGAPHQQTHNFLKIIKERTEKIGRMSEMGA
jgi:hypothetical protein